LRGEIIPIVDLRERFGLQAAEPTKETRIVLVELEQFTVGLIVDRVFEVFQIFDNEIGHMPPISQATIGKQFIKGVVEVKDKLIILLGLRSIFSDEETETLSLGV
jgi:purine-binding chemotaxis protein CheW